MMGLVKYIVLLLAVGLGAWLAGFGSEEPKCPEIRRGWFGRGPMQPEKDTSIRPFIIQTTNKSIQDLYDRLDRTRFGEDLEGGDFNYGFQATYMRTIVQYWRHKFDWKKQEEKLNAYPHYKTTIEGLGVHFIHIKPSNGRSPRVVLLLHGWPGSVWEFYKMIPLLNDPHKHGLADQEALQLVIPSIPGYGFSEQPHQKGFTQEAAGRIMHALMVRLGHTGYYIQAGDQGSIIANFMAVMYPKHVLGLHINFLTEPMGFLPMVHLVCMKAWPSLFMTEYEARVFSSKSVMFSLRESGYFHLQATKPDTIGMALVDTPVGLAGYLLEKYSTGTNASWLDLPDGGLTKVYTLDDLLTNIMIYWLNGNIGSSQRLYKEMFYDFERYTLLSRVPTEIPVGITQFENDISYVPRSLAEHKYKNIVHFALSPGGHFAPIENPVFLTTELFSFLDKVEKSQHT